MTKYKGFELVRVIKATTTPNYGGNGAATHLYEAEVHGIMGQHSPSKHIVLNQFQRDYGKDIGMTKCQHGVLIDGTVRLLTQVEYDALVKEWQAA